MLYWDIYLGDESFAGSMAIDVNKKSPGFKPGFFVFMVFGIYFFFFRPAAFLSFFTMSVFSQVNVASFLPKCPPCAVSEKTGLASFRCLIIFFGVKGKICFTMVLIFFSLILAVPSVSISTEIGFATPIA